MDSMWHTSDKSLAKLNNLDIHGFLLKSISLVHSKVVAAIIMHLSRQFKDWTLSKQDAGCNE